MPAQEGDELTEQAGLPAHDNGELGFVLPRMVMGSIHLIILLTHAHSDLRIPVFFSCPHILNFRSRLGRKSRGRSYEIEFELTIGMDRAE